MKNLLIIYPHWYPVNLAGVHRPRLIANHLNEFDWNPYVITVKERFFEEVPDSTFKQGFTDKGHLIRTNALKAPGKFRIIGDIGLRAFYYLFKEAVKLLKGGKIDFVWIPIPSFYVALLGRLLHEKTGVKYGIDYIDPWVRDISTRRNWRHQLSNHLARFLEPIAVKKASVITGVSYQYYEPVLRRNFKEIGGPTNALWVNENLKEGRFNHASFPYGFDANDYKNPIRDNYLWGRDDKIKPWVYAGAFLPKSRLFMRLFLSTIAELRQTDAWDKEIRMYFVGTGYYEGPTINDIAQEYDLGDIIEERSQRYPYFDVLGILAEADTVMVIGSTEAHYTASKIYQGLLSERPIWSILHEKSSAVQVLKDCDAHQHLVTYREDCSEEELRSSIREAIVSRINSDNWAPNLEKLDQYSARASTSKLIDTIESVLDQN